MTTSTILLGLLVVALMVTAAYLAGYNEGRDDARKQRIAAMRSVNKARREGRIIDEE